MFDKLKLVMILSLFIVFSFQMLFSDNLNNLDYEVLKLPYKKENFSIEYCLIKNSIKKYDTIHTFKFSPFIINDTAFIINNNVYFFSKDIPYKGGYSSLQLEQYKILNDSVYFQKEQYLGDYGRIYDFKFDKTTILIQFDKYSIKIYLEAINSTKRFPFNLIFDSDEK